MWTGNGKERVGSVLARSGSRSVSMWNGGSEVVRYWSCRGGSVVGEIRQVIWSGGGMGFGPVVVGPDGGPTEWLWLGHGLETPNELMPNGPSC